jgi:hypothetical protein
VEEVAQEPLEAHGFATVEDDDGQFEQVVPSHSFAEEGPTEEFIPDDPATGEAEMLPEPGDIHSFVVAGSIDSGDEPLPGIELDAPIDLGPDAALADRLWAAREVADTAREAEGRSRSALYKALSYAYDFALASKADPEGYAELLEDSGVKAQARAPMTPVVKLVFGIDHDKARLTEYAAALSYAEREEIELGGFLAFIEAGGLKSLVAAERLARRPQPKEDTKTERARRQLRDVAPMSLAEVSADVEFALVLTRRSADGGHQPVAVVDDPALVERAIRQAANC